MGERIWDMDLCAAELRRTGRLPADLAALPTSGQAFLGTRCKHQWPVGRRIGVWEVIAHETKGRVRLRCIDCEFEVVRTPKRMLTRETGVDWCAGCGGEIVIRDGRLRHVERLVREPEIRRRWPTVKAFVRAFGMPPNSNCRLRPIVGTRLSPLNHRWCD